MHIDRADRFRDKTKVPARSAVCAVMAVLALGLSEVQAQQTGPFPRIGILTGAAGHTPRTLAVRDELQAHGYQDGKNVSIEWRFAGARPEAIPQFAAELVSLGCAVIVAAGNPIIGAVRKSTATIPVVMISEDPIQAGFVTSLSRPAGNMTGVSGMSPGLAAKRLEVLKEALPRLSRAAVLVNPQNAGQVEATGQIRSAGERLGVAIEVVQLHGPGDLESAFDSMVRLRVQAVLGFLDAVTFSHRARIGELALQRHISAAFDFSEFPLEGGALMSYGPSLTWGYRRSAYYVAKILDGMKPSDLPIEQPTKFDLVINLRTAKALGLTIPPTILLRADRVIE